MGCWGQQTGPLKSDGQGNGEAKLKRNPIFLASLIQGLHVMMSSDDVIRVQAEINQSLHQSYIRLSIRVKSEFASGVKAKSKKNQS